MISRRRFLQSSASLALLPLLPRVATSTTSVAVRQNWQVFCTGPTFQSMVNGVRAMRSINDTTNPASWAYWANVHKNFCPHGKPYFLAWHRGLLLRFEGWLRKASGDDALVLPYWDYYTQPQMPPEFLDTTSSLYRKGRTGSDVTAALSLDPFADSVVNFPRGMDNALEPIIEARPHNPVHNLIGGVMGQVSVSPWDPIFWVHHANIDRLWAAWVKAGNGRQMPAASDPYWTGSFQYGSAIKPVPRSWTISTTHQYLNYQYDDESMPSSLPSSGSYMSRSSSFAAAGSAPLKPATVQTMAMGTARPLALDDRSINVDVALSAQDTNRVRSMLLQPAASKTAAAGALRLVLDGVQTTALGDQGGYFYKIFVNLPETAGVHPAEQTYLLGMVGPFEISVAQMQAAMKGKGMQGMDAGHGKQDAQFVFPISDTLRRLAPMQLDKLSISFVRADGGRRPPKGDTIRIKSFRVVADN
ncbi:tyrosinase family protein [Frateuria terrea]|uniref:Tyrosinase n=1 Tax=Frateuria terrea TaxID=529704 RepID=A0A1H6YXJ5_9GAMM|nr:tyrosinase family protein [Frateuria terrea]SEJ45921.1 tyrosinase [Frateuria terrea]SFP76570.1 tyrosinase [Frateuria terrea]